MKKFLLLLMIFILLFAFCACFDFDLVIGSLPAYNSKSFYTSGGFQDYTDYAKYTYEIIDTQDFESSKYFSEATDADVDEILLYIDDFEDWVDAVDGELKENYDFDKSVVSAGDFFYIKTKAGEPIGQGTYDKYDNYTLYYFDRGGSVLYYFHNNI